MQSSVLPGVPTTTFVFNLLTLTLSLLPLPSLPLSLCRTSCGSIPVSYPFAVDDGCGSPSFRRMLSCNASDLFFATPSGDYKVQSIDYAKRKVVVFDPAMSTCSVLQPHHDFALTDVQAALIPPSDDTLFAVLNCSVDSPVANHFKYLCSPDVGGHSCAEMYSACASFRIFRPAAPQGQGGNLSLPSPSPSTSASPPCCFTRYATVRFMSMNMLDCTHYTTVIDSGGLEKAGPLDWTYGIELTYAVPESTACDRCKRSGGACGFDAESEAMLCLCSPTLNATVECAAGTGTGSGQKLAPTMSYHATLLIILTSIVYTNLV
ncbi:hypothetical protein BT93_L0091 [Corymbia citriodora subsp. variegata]|uniref:non-specific serine/threonine protein kinase n=1 Tax=Corymbia citriodora subsp. variegata TaxID=360336 RepID=A0A8T0CQP8_CORYI|nr:hypothetical protein BT93_L0091 [Corymbia citriodora subsp. variegata]